MPTNSAYAQFINNLDDEMIVYESDSTRLPFIITIDQVIPNSPQPGVELSFEGILYNQADPSDSLIISNGNVYTITQPGFDFNHCR